MFELVVAIQIIGIVIIAHEIVYIARQRNSKCQIYLLIMQMSLLVNFVGYMFELFANDKGRAIMGVKFGYIGKPFIMYTMFMFVMEFCGIKVKDIIKMICLSIHIAVIIMVQTCDHHNLYYSSIDYTYDGIFPHLVLGHSAIYNIYTSLLMVYFIVIIYVAGSRIKKLKDGNVKKQLKAFIAIVVICIGGLVCYMVGITGGYDTTLFTYVISSVVLSVLIIKYDLIDTVTFAKDEALTEFQDGLIVINNEGNVIYINESAKELQDIALQDNANSKDDFYEQLSSLAKDGKYYICNEKVYNIKERDIVKKNKTFGHMFVLTDVTDSYNYTGRLEEAVAEKTREVVRIQRSVIASFATMIEARDGITGLHIKNTSNFVKVIVDAMKLSDRYPEVTAEYAEMVAEAASMHDIGKIAIPDYVLTKPGKLTNEEYRIMQGHPQAGEKILRETLSNLENDEYLQIACDMALYHHEKWNGEGYPTRKSGKEIPLAARIMAIADVYDALRSKRQYKDGFSVEKSVQIMRESSGSHFDPEITEIFLENIDKIEKVFVENK